MSLASVQQSAGTSPHAIDLQGRAVLLATDGSSGSIAGAYVALELARQRGCVIHAVSVVDTRSAAIPPPLDIALDLGDALIGERVNDEQVEAVRSALSEAMQRPIAWPIRKMLGTPAGAIVEEARRIDAALIVVGLRRHGRLERTFSDETALNVMRRASCPVLAVVPGTTQLPRRVLAAVDFSETSLHALHSARAIVGPTAFMVLAHVQQPLTASGAEGKQVIHELGIEAAFARIHAELGNDPERADHVVLHSEGDRPSAELLLEYAEGARCDLIAAGSAHHGRLERWLMGSVSTDLVRDGTRSILLVAAGRPAG